MAVIKSANTPSQARPFSMADIENHARGMLLRARKQAEELLAAAQGDAEAMWQRAKAEGFAEGKQEGVLKGREEGLKLGKDQAYKEQSAQLTGLVGTLTTLTTELNHHRLALESHGVEDVIHLAIAIAERVTKQRGVLDPAVAVANVTEALKLVSHASDVRIAVHPSQKLALEQALPVLRMHWPQLQHVQLLEDEALAPGGCRLYTMQGQVDGDLDEQLRRIVADLLPSNDQSQSEQSPAEGM